MMLKRKSVALGFCLAVLAGACATPGPTVSSQSAPTVNFARYSTFGFYPEVAEKIAYSSFLAQYLRDSITRQMQARGFRLAENPDLLINYQVLTKDRITVSQTPSSYYGYRRGMYAWGGPTLQTDVSSYSEGTLNIDVVDRAARQLLWEGIAVGRIREAALKDPQPAVESVITQVFADFPGRASAAAPAQ